MAYSQIDTQNDSDKQEDMVTISREDFEKFKLAYDNESLFDGTLEIRRARKMVSGSNTTWVDGDLKFIQTLAMRAILCGLHLDIKCKKTLQDIEKAKSEYPADLMDFFDKRSPITPSRQALKSEKSQ